MASPSAMARPTAVISPISGRVDLALRPRLGRLGLEELPNVAAWRSRIKARPAVRAGVDLGKEWRRRAPRTPEERAVLFNQTGRLPGR